MRPVDVDLVSSLPTEGVRVTWIGHATTLVQFDETNILTDPIFSERCSFSQYVGPKRYRSAPANIKELMSSSVLSKILHLAIIVSEP